jgi:PmbA protein
MPNNVVVAKGKGDVLHSVKKGLYVRSLLGVHTMNEATGDFSLGIVEGFYVEDGEVKHAVKDAMVAGNFFDMMNNVQELGAKLEHSLDISGGCYMPEMLFEKLKVVGK